MFWQNLDFTKVNMNKTKAQLQRQLYKTTRAQLVKLCSSLSLKFTTSWLISHMARKSPFLQP